MLRVRDTIKNLGDLPPSPIPGRTITGLEIDFDVVGYHTVYYNAQTVLSAAPLIAKPSREGRAHVAFRLVRQQRPVGLRGHRRTDRASNSTRSDTEVDTLPLYPDIRPLVDRLSNRGPELSIGDHQRPCSFVSPGTSNAWTKSALDMDRADLDDAAELLGRRPEPQDLDAALVAFIPAPARTTKRACSASLNRRVQRQHLTLGTRRVNDAATPTTEAAFDPVRMTRKDPVLPTTFLGLPGSSPGRGSRSSVRPGPTGPTCRGTPLSSSYSSTSQTTGSS